MKEDELIGSWEDYRHVLAHRPPGFDPYRRPGGEGRHGGINVIQNLEGIVKYCNIS